MRRPWVDVGHRHLDELCVRAFGRHPEQVEGARLCAWIRPPAERRIDHDFPSEPGVAFGVASGDDLAGGVGAEDCGKTNAGVLAAANPDIAVIDRGRLHAHNNLAWAGHRRWPLLYAKVARILKFPQDDCAHGPYGLDVIHRRRGIDRSVRNLPSIGSSFLTPRI